MERIGVGFILCERVLGLVFGRVTLVNDSLFLLVHLSKSMSPVVVSTVLVRRPASFCICCFLISSVH